MRLSDIPDDCPLPRDTLYGIAGVSDSQFSVARHYGGCTYQGQSYVYLPMTDELIRWDVFQWLHKRARTLRRQARVEASAQQERLF